MPTSFDPKLYTRVAYREVLHPGAPHGTGGLVHGKLEFMVLHLRADSPPYARE